MLYNKLWNYLKFKNVKSKDKQIDFAILGVALAKLHG